MTLPIFTLPDFDLKQPSFDDFRKALKNNYIKITDDEEDLGFIGFFYGNNYSGFTKNGNSYTHIPLFFYEDDKLNDRVPFDSAFSEYQDAIIKLKGNPIEHGRYVYPHRNSSHYYLYSVWQLTHCCLALLQNEYDIQFGLDVSLRFIYQTGNVKELLFGYNTSNS